MIRAKGRLSTLQATQVPQILYLTDEPMAGPKTMNTVTQTSPQSQSNPFLAQLPPLVWRPSRGMRFNEGLRKECGISLGPAVRFTSIATRTHHAPQSPGPKCATSGKEASSSINKHLSSVLGANRIYNVPLHFLIIVNPLPGSKDGQRYLNAD